MRARNTPKEKLSGAVGARRARFWVFSLPGISCTIFKKLFNLSPTMSSFIKWGQAQIRHILLYFTIWNTCVWDCVYQVFSRNYININLSIVFKTEETVDKNLLNYKCKEFLILNIRPKFLIGEKLNLSFFRNFMFNIKL